MRVLKLIVIFMILFGIIISLRTMNDPPKKTAKSHLFARSSLMQESRASLHLAVVSVSTTTSSTTTTIPPTTTHTHPSPSTTGSVPVMENIWTALANCESRMNQRATSRSGAYLGYFQFSISTWRSVGGPGDPRDHDYSTQLKYAQILQARSGWNQWPGCSRKLGLR